MVRYSILLLFQTGRKMLDKWQDLTSRMYPNWPDLLERITGTNKLTTAKLANEGWVMNNNCNAERKYCRLIVESTKQIAEEEGIRKD